MLTFSGGRIFLVTGPTDMRKSFNGLSGIARERLGATPASRDLFMFCNRNRNRMKGKRPKPSPRPSGGAWRRILTV